MKNSAIIIFTAYSYQIILTAPIDGRPNMRVAALLALGLRVTTGTGK